MKFMTRALPLLFLLTLASFAQTASYTFGGTLSGYYVLGGHPQSLNGCVNNTSWNGTSYPADNGEFCINYEPTVSGITIPYELGFPNNGYLLQSCTMTFGSPVYTSGNGTQVGDTFSISGSATCNYNVNITSFTQNFVVTSVVTHCRYGKCITDVNYSLIGGSGTVTVN
jgi:hypothetical protein